MKRLLAFLLLLSSFSQAQITNNSPHYKFTKKLSIGEKLQLPSWLSTPSQADTNLIAIFNGKVYIQDTVLGVYGWHEVGGGADSAIFATLYRVDTAKSNIRSQIKTYYASNGLRLDGDTVKLANNTTGFVLTDNVKWDGGTNQKQINLWGKNALLGVTDLMTLYAATGAVDSAYVKINDLGLAFNYNVYADADQTLRKKHVYHGLPVITANRTVTFPSRTDYKHLIFVYNKNTSAFSWNIAGAAVKEADGTSITSLTNGTFYQFMWDGTSWVRMNAGSTGGSTTLAGLTDVSITSPATDQVLKYNGTEWVNGTAGGSVAIPATRIPFGNGAGDGLSSSANLTYDGTKLSTAYSGTTASNVISAIGGTGGNSVSLGLDYSGTYFPRIYFDYTDNVSSGFVNRFAGVNQMFFGMSNEGIYGGTTGTTSGRGLGIHDQTGGGWRWGINASGDMFVGSSPSTYGMKVTQAGATTINGELTINNNQGANITGTVRATKFYSQAAGTSSSVYPLHIVNNTATTDLFRVAEDGNTTIGSGGKLTLAKTGTNRDVSFMNASGIDNVGRLQVQTASGTNTSGLIEIIPKGTGAFGAAAVQSQLSLLNKDFIADDVNYEALNLLASGTAGYIIGNIKNGTGTLRPINIDATGTSGATTKNITFTTEGNTNIGTSTPVTNAIFQVASTSKGSIPSPKMTTTQRDAIGSPVEGLQVFNTTTHKPNYHNGTSWIDGGENLYTADGTLSGNRAVTAGSNTLTISGSGSRTLAATNSNTSGEALYGSATNGGRAGSFATLHSSTNTLREVVRVARESSGTAADQIGGVVTFYTEDAGGNLQQSGGVASKWIDATAGSSATGAVQLQAKGNNAMVDLEQFGGAETTTANATPTTLQTIKIPDETAGIFEFAIVGKEAATAGRMTGKKIVAYDKNSGTLTLGTPSVILADQATGTISAATWSITTSADNIIIQVTGVAGTNINWKVSFKNLYN